MHDKTKKSILFLIPPASGHLNPVISIASELCQRSHIRCFIYSTDKYKSLVQNSGAEFRHYATKEMHESFEPTPEKPFTMYNMFKSLIESSHTELPALIEASSQIKPNLIVYDRLAVFAKYLINFLEIKAKHNELDYPVPKEVRMCPSFAFLPNIYPNAEERKTMLGSNMDFDALEKLEQEVHKKFGINYSFISNGNFRISESNNMCSVFEELQPKVDLMRKHYHFIGCCVDESVRGSVPIKNEELKRILDSFEEINPIDLNNQKQQAAKLIYVSLGTVFNFAIETFEKIINAINMLENDDNYRVIMSVGKQVYQKYQDKINNGNYHMPQNVLILPSVPQIDILKRASLYITHCGMNSTSETIHYGVPVIGIPQSVDQPLVAVRICDELKLGIRLNTNTFTSTQLRDSIQEVLGNQIYLRKILEYSKISRQQNGCINGANLLLAILNE